MTVRGVSLSILIVTKNPLDPSVGSLSTRPVPPSGENKPVPAGGPWNIIVGMLTNGVAEGVANFTGPPIGLA
jgi:hypothetical protein